MTTGHAKPYGNGITEPIHPIDPEALEAAATRAEAWLRFDAINRPGWGSIRDVSYEGYPISSADLEILVVDYRHHRPTQDAYDRACEALDKQRARADAAEAELGRLRQAIVDAGGEATAESIRADVAEAQRDQARDIAYAYRRAPSAIRIPWSNPAISLVELADEIVLSVVKVDALPEWLGAEPKGHEAKDDDA
jgi:hypothetical protein